MSHMDKETNNTLEAALLLIEDKMAKAYWNCFHREMNSPFRNTGQSIDLGLFKVAAYDWCLGESQPYNFQWKDIQIKWYKSVGRCLEVNRPITLSDISTMLTECLDYIAQCECCYETRR